MSNIIALCTAVVLLITAIGGYKRSNKTQSHIQEIHFLVNSRLTDSLERTNQLLTILKDNNISVPKELK
jgi:hypothetical protein